MSQQWIYTFVYLAWLAGAACFVLGLHQMNSPATARNGNRLSATGMVIAVGATLVYLVTREGGLSATALVIIVVGFLIGGGAGLYTARTVKMTAMPQLVSLFNAVGGGAAALVAIDDFIRLNSGAPVDTTIFVVLGALIGSVTFTGSLIAGGKLQGLIPGKPIYVPGGQHDHPQEGDRGAAAKGEDAGRAEDERDRAEQGHQRDRDRDQLAAGHVDRLTRDEALELAAGDQGAAERH